MLHGEDIAHEAKCVLTCNKLEHRTEGLVHALLPDAMWMTVPERLEEALLKLQWLLHQVHSAHHSGAIVNKELFRKAPKDEANHRTSLYNKDPKRPLYTGNVIFAAPNTIFCIAGQSVVPVIYASELYAFGR